jgi:glycerol kinase
MMTAGKVHATDYSNAARTSLFNIHTRTWDEELLNLFNIPKSVLPEVKDSSGMFGFTAPSFCEHPIPICGIAGDQQAALFGQGCFEVGMAKNTYGTGCFMLMNTGNNPVRSRHGLLTTIAWSLNGQITYALEGSVFIAGSAVKWLRDQLNLIQTADETEEIASSIPSAEGVYFVPAFVGLGTPYWNAEVRGSFFGLSQSTNRKHLIRSALEAMAYQTRDVFETMELDSGIPLSSLRVDGGASKNNLVMQFQSDILNLKIDRPLISETTALGAAMLAGLACGLWKDEQACLQLRKTEKFFRPEISESERQLLYAGWRKAVNATISFHS